MRRPPQAGFDSTLALKRHGYAFISQRCDAVGSDVFRTRLLLQRVYCIRGREAADLFYDIKQPLTRRGSLPKSILHLLQDEGSVQTLDRGAHEYRKLMFLSLMSPPAIERVARLFADAWEEQLPIWRRRGQIVLLHVMHELLTSVGAAWSGLGLDMVERSKRAREFAAMIADAGTIGPRNWRARWLRRRTEAWARQRIARIRQGKTDTPQDAAVSVIARHLDRDGHALPLEVAAVELLNVLRPIVAIARFITFAALALHEFPRWRETFATGDETDLENFALEVRRFYPFFPAVGAKATEALAFQGYRLPKNALLLFDLYGTNHDDRLWEAPLEFRPERFRGWRDDGASFVPQGGGNVMHSHRCPGEAVTMAVLAQAVRALSQLDYDVPVQDLGIRLNRMPAQPESGFLISLRGA